MSFGEIADPVRFARQWLGFEPDEKQAIVLDPTIRRGLLNCTRQWGKSTIMAVKALHLACTQPGSNVVVLSPTEAQAGTFFEVVREFAVTLGIPPKGDGVHRHAVRLPNGSRVVGIGGRSKRRGLRKVALLLVDEAAEVPEAAYKAIRPVLATVGKSGGALWLLSTPEGRQGFFWNAWENEGDRWFRMSVTAEECDRISKDFLQEEREVMGELLFRQEYMCEFLDTADALFSSADLEASIDRDVPTLWG